MSVFPSDIEVYGSANMPETDGALIGGSFDSTKSVVFFDITVNGPLSAVSGTTGDTGVKFSTLGRDATGGSATFIGTLNGTTQINGTATMERILAGVITGGAIAGLANPGGTAAGGDAMIFGTTLVLSGRTAQAGSANGTGITPALFKLQAGDGASVSIGQIIRTRGGLGRDQMRRIIATTGYGTDFVAVNRNWGTVPDATTTYDVANGMLFTFLPNPVAAITRTFATSASDAVGGVTRTFYEKVFVVNNNTATSLTPASPNPGVGIQLSGETPALPGGVLLDLGLEAALNGTASVANRQTAPPGVSFVTQPANAFVPGAGNLPSGVAPNAAGAQGAWLRLTVPAGSSPYKGAITYVQSQGNTT